MVRAIKTVAAAALALALLGGGAGASEEGAEVTEREWSFQGIFGEFDKPSLQRGLQVYMEVCSSCHSLKRVAYRNLIEIGLDVDAVKALAAEAFVVDGPNDEGEMFERDGKPSDRFVPPFANDNAARFANNGALPPDLSLFAKSNHIGPDYIVALLMGYEEPGDEVEMGEGMSYNPVFPGGQIAMPQPLDEDYVEYADGTAATIEQMSVDVTNFLVWAAEPSLEVRKRIGLKVVIFLIVLSALLYATKRKLWANLH